MAAKKKTNQPTTSLSAAEMAANAAAQAAAMMAEAERLRQEAERLAAEEARLAALEAEAAQISLEGRSKGALRNLRKRQRKAAAVEAAAVEEERYDSMKEEVHEKYDVVEPSLSAAREETVAALQAELNAIVLPGSADEIRAQADSLKSALRALLSRAESALDENVGDAVAALENFDPVKMYMQLKELEEDGTEDPENLAWIEGDLIKTLKWNFYTSYRKQLTAIAEDAAKRVARINGAIETAKALEKERSTIKRIADLKRVDESTIPTNAAVVTELLEINSEAAAVLAMGMQAATESSKLLRDIAKLPGSFLTGWEQTQKVLRDFFRSKEREFGVFIERKPEKYSRDTVVLTGLAEDVENCMISLRKLDFSGVAVYPNELGKSLGAIMGKQGANLKHIEENFGVFVLATSTLGSGPGTAYKNNQIEVYGPAENVKKAFAYLDATIAAEDNASPVPKSDKKDEKAAPLALSVDIEVDAVKASALRNSILRNIESDFPELRTLRVKNPHADGRTNYLEALPAAAEAQKATVVIRGATEASVAGAKKAVESFINSKVAIEKVSLTDAQYNRLTVDEKAKDSYKKISDIPSRVLRECVLFRSNQTAGYVFISATGDKKEIVLVGEKTELPSMTDLLKVVLEKADVVTEKIELAKDVIRAIPNIEIVRLESEFPSASIIVAIGSRKGDEDDKRTPAIIIKGATDAIEAIVKKVKALAEKYGSTATIADVSSPVIGNLLGRSAANLRELEAINKVVISIIRATEEGKRDSIVITGSAEGVEATKKFIQDTARVVDNTKTVDIKLENGQGAILIGPKGATIRKIAALVQRADVAKDSSKVSLKGLPNQIEEAEKLIKEILEEHAVKIAAKNKKTEEVAVEAPAAVVEQPAVTAAEFPAIGEAVAKEQDGFWTTKKDDETREEEPATAAEEN